MNGLSVFHYQSPRSFILDSISERQKVSKGFSMRALSRRMGVSHSWLVLVLQSKRNLRAEHAASFARALELSTRERLYLQALIQYVRADSAQEKQMHAHSLADLHPGKEFRTKEIDEYEVLSHWLHLTLLSMLNLKNCERTATSLHKRIRSRATIHEVRAALERLLDCGLVTRGEDGRFSKNFEYVTTANDVRNEGARNYHKGVLGLAISAADEQRAQEREFQSFSLSLEESRIPEAKEMIREFRLKFIKMFASESGDSVYQANLQFFRMTDPDRGSPRSPK